MAPTQVAYVFSDKTGTLTSNVMQLRRLHMHGHSFGAGTTSIGLARAKAELQASAWGDCDGLIACV